MLKKSNKAELRAKTVEELVAIIKKKQKYLVSKVLAPEESASMKLYEEAKKTISFIKTILTEKGKVNDNA